MALPPGTRPGVYEITAQIGEGGMGQVYRATDTRPKRQVAIKILPPAVAKVRSDGTVKVLDFGLAKAMEPTGDGGACVDVADDHVTRHHADGDDPRHRGVYVAGAGAWQDGRQAGGHLGLRVRTVRDAHGAARIRWRRRRRDSGECHQQGARLGGAAVRLALEGAFETTTPKEASVGVPSRLGVALVGAVALLVGAVIAGVSLWVATRPTDRVPPRVSRLALALPGTAALTLNAGDRDVAMTPDGSRLVYVGNRGTQLFVRTLDALDPVAVFTGAPRGPFVSPDGQWVGFVDGATTLKKVAVTGGPAVSLATIDADTPRGATWGDGTLEVMTNLDRTFRNVTVALGTLSDEIRHSSPVTTADD